MTLNLTDIEQIAAETALKAWNEKTHYSKFSHIISKGFQAQRDVIVEMVEGMMQDEYPTEDGVPVETYGYEQTHNQALRAVIKALQPPTEICGQIIMRDSGYGQYKIPPQPDEIVVRCNQKKPCPHHPTEKSGTSLRSFDPAIEDLSGYYATPTDTEKGWEKRLEDYVAANLNDGESLDEGKVMVDLRWTVNTIKSFIATELTRARNEALEEAAKAVEGESFKDPAEGGQFGLHASGYNQGLEEAVDAIRALISKDDTTQV
ncbi:MAG TPA: hypothetical protein VIY48_20470 [Candidatus Paceibacterota bacterium]